MSYLDFIPNLPVFTGRGCVEELKRVLERMGDPHKKVKCVHVAGTNGKGSVCAMIEYALRRAGYKTGLYTSPYLVRFNERIKIEGRDALDEQLELSARRVYEAQGGEKLTHFGFITAMMFDMFARADVELAVVEAGMGGGTDPTVLCRPMLCAITGVDLDHTAILGDTLEKIAAEKAGIIKPGVPIVLGVCASAPAEIIKNEALRQRAPFYPVVKEDVSEIECSLSGTGFHFRGESYILELLGAHQAYNAAAAIMCLEELKSRYGINVSPGDISQASWPGRLALKLYNGREILLDGAHNCAGAGALAQFLNTAAGGRRIIIVCAVMKDKDYGGLSERLARAASAAVAVGMPDYPRALAASELKHAFEERGIPAYETEELSKGLSLAMELDGEALIVVCGSLYLVGEALRLIEERENNEQGQA